MSPEDFICSRCPSTPRILGSLVSGMQHQFQKTQRVLCQQQQGQRTKAGPSTPRILGSLRPVYTGEHMGSRSNRASWTGSLWAFILSQEAELRPRPLGTFLARGESAYREGSDPRTQEVESRESAVERHPGYTGSSGPMQTTRDLVSKKRKKTRSPPIRPAKVLFTICSSTNSLTTNTALHTTTKKPLTRSA